MSSEKTFKCIHCGAQLRFEPWKQKLVCDACGSSYFPVDYRDQMASRLNMAPEDFDQISLSVCTCPGCGAQIITSAAELVRTCVYCGTEITVADRLPDRFHPDWIVPFRLTQEEAERKFEDTVRNNRLAPYRFRKQLQLKKMQGLYVPVWLYSASVHGSIRCRGIYRKKLSGFLKGGIYFNSQFNTAGTIYEEAQLNYHAVCENGLKEMDDRLVETVGPFDFENAAAFQSAYLAGFSAQRVDIDEDTMNADAEERLRASVREELTTHAWQNVYRNFSEKELKGINRRWDTRASAKELAHTSGFQYEVTEKSVSLGLIPVWLMYTQYHGKQYVFAVNGENGKTAGNIPVSPLRAAAAALSWEAVLDLFMTLMNLSAVMEAAVYLLGAIVWGGMLVRALAANRKKSRNHLVRLNKRILPEVMWYRTLHHEENDL